ncbi:MAG: hypothetical protein PHW15_00595 [Patescibacteria group bacterium]|jgi:uncharacterized membrane protein YjdF|nr:hypothetical protein [Patescibacteria group bacterium]MDD5172902.1 hypothetical protein [Patescibacteria group bacterium]
MQKKIRIFLIIVVLVFLILHFLGWYKYYYNLEHYDKAVHFFAGASVVSAVLWFLGIKEIKGVNKKLVSLIFLFLVSIIWEIFEYLTDHVFSRPLIGILQPMQPTYLDTIGDFLADFIGGFMVLFFTFFKGQKQDK